MKDIFLLIKIFLINGLRPDRSKNKKAGLIAVYIVLGLAYISIIAGGITLIAYAAPFMKKANLLAELVTLIYIIGIGMVVVFGIISLLTYVYFNKDAEFTASLPIKPGKVFLAKLAIVYIYELAAFAAIVIPLLITTGIVTSQGVIYYLSILLGFFLAPAFPLAIASIVAIPLMYVVSFFKNKGAFTTIFMMIIYGVFFGFYFYGVMKLQSSGEEIGNNIENMIPNMSATLQSISKIFYPVYAIACLATGKVLYGLNVPLSGLINLGISVGSLLALLIIAYFISNAVYQQSTIRQNESAKTVVKAEKTESRSALKALMIKEFREIIRTSAFGFQCLAGAILLPLILILMSFNMGNVGNAAELSGNLLSNINYALCFGFLLMLGSGMNVTSSTAISREGKNFYLSKIIPVDYTTQIKAKVYLALIINLITVFIGYIFSIFVYRLSVIEIIFFPIVLAMYSYGYAFATIRFDLKEPKLNWTTPNEAVKNNKTATVPTLINMAVSFLIMILLIVLYVMLNVFGTQANLPDYLVILIKIGAWLLITGAAVAFAVISRIRLFGSVGGLYEKIEP